MLFETGKYYHLHRPSDEGKIIFKEEINYLFFLERYQLYLGELVSTLAYCLLPSEFHFIIKVNTADCDLLEKNLAEFLNGYAKAINNGFARNGDALQLQVKAHEIDGEHQLLPAISRVHQRPVEAKVAAQMEKWKYSSYPYLTGLRNGVITSGNFILQQYFPAETIQKSSEG